jgi:hypothetical protein
LFVDEVFKGGKMHMDHKGQKFVGSLQLFLKREGAKIEVKNDDQIEIERPRIIKGVFNSLRK